MKYYFLFFLLFHSLELFSKSDEIQQKIDKRIQENSNLMEKSPHQTLINLRDLKNESLNAKYSHGVIKSTLLIIEILLRTRVDYIQILEESKLGLQTAKDSNDFSAIIQFHQYRSMAYYNLGLFDSGFHELEYALSYTGKLADPNERNLKIAYIYGAMAPYYKFKNDHKNHLFYLRKSLNRLKLVDDSSEYLLEKKRITALQYADLGYLLNSQHKIDSAEIYYNKSHQLFNQYHLPLFDKTRVLLVMSRFYFQRKNYPKAIRFSHSGLDVTRENNHPILKREFYNILFKAYLETNQIDSSKYYSRLYDKANENIQSINNSTVNTVFEKYRKQNETDNSHRIRNVLILIVITCATVAMGSAHWIKSNRKSSYQREPKIQHMENYVHKMKIEVINDLKSSAPHTGSVNITSETVAFLLKKLDKFERSNRFTKQDVTLSSIAYDMGTNSRYISQIIKEHRGKNFNAYINSLRIGFITQKLQEDPNFRKYKIAYLAQYAGFSSGVVFTTIFKKETGMTPSSYINLLTENV